MHRRLSSSVMYVLTRDNVCDSKNNISVGKKNNKNNKRVVLAEQFAPERFAVTL